jgi:hypothetical protein
MLGFVYFNGWRSFISCQIFCERGRVGRKIESGQLLIGISETVKGVRKII